MRGIDELTAVEKETEKQTSGVTVAEMVTAIYKMLVAQEPESETETETETETLTDEEETETVTETEKED